MNQTTRSFSQHDALIYVMVTLAAVDRTMTDRELRTIGDTVKRMPVFTGFNVDHLVKVTEECGRMLQTDTGLDDVLDLIMVALPERLYDTAYALAVEVAAADLFLEQEELRFLRILRDRLELDQLTAAAIETSARARYRKA